MHSVCTSRFTHQSAQFCSWSCLGCSPDWVSIRTMISMFFFFFIHTLWYPLSRTVVLDQVALTVISEESPIKYRTPYWSPRGWSSFITLWENIGLSSSRPQTKDEGERMFGKEPFEYCMYILCAINAVLQNACSGPKYCRNYFLILSPPRVDTFQLSGKHNYSSIGGCKSLLWNAILPVYATQLDRNRLIHMRHVRNNEQLPPVLCE